MISVKYAESEPQADEGGGVHIVTTYYIFIN